MKNKKTITAIIVAVAIVGIAAFIIFSGSNEITKSETDPKDLYKGPNVIKRTVKLKNIPRFKKIIEQQSSLRSPNANSKAESQPISTPTAIDEKNVTLEAKQEKK